MDDSIERLIRAHMPEIQAITRELRAEIKTAMLEAYETIYHGALSYSLSDYVYERLVYLALEKGYVRQGFNFGGYLPDHQHLLTGEGKRLRHVKVHSPEQAKAPAIRHLVQAAWEMGNTHGAEVKAEHSNKRNTSKVD